MEHDENVVGVYPFGEDEDAIIYESSQELPVPSCCIPKLCPIESFENTKQKKEYKKRTKN